MKKIALLIAASAICITSCKKDYSTSPPPVNEMTYKLSGNYRPPSAELLTIQSNLEKLSKLSFSEQKKFITSLTPLRVNEAKLMSTRNNRSINQVNGSGDEENYGDWAAVISNPANDVEWPDNSDFEGRSVGGFNFMYKWVVAYGYFKAFSVQSQERCELLYVGTIQSDWTINNILHQGSLLFGISGPVTWTEISNLNYFNPGGTNAYFYVAGALAVPSIGAISVENHRYANAQAIAGIY